MFPSLPGAHGPCRKGLTDATRLAEPGLGEPRVEPQDSGNVTDLAEFGIDVDHHAADLAGGGARVAPDRTRLPRPPGTWFEDPRRAATSRMWRKFPIPFHDIAGTAMIDPTRPVRLRG